MKTAEELARRIVEHCGNHPSILNKNKGDIVSDIIPEIEHFAQSLQSLPSDEEIAKFIITKSQGKWGDYGQGLEDGIEIGAYWVRDNHMMQAEQIDWDVIRNYIQSKFEIELGVASSVKLTEDNINDISNQDADDIVDYIKSKLTTKK